MSLVLNKFCEHTDSVDSLAFLDSETFISGSFDKTIKLWNIHQSTSLRTYYDTDAITCLLILDSQTFISVSYNKKIIKIWDKNKTEPINVYNIKIDSIAVFPDGEHFIVSCFETIKLFSKNSESVLREYKGDIIYKGDLKYDDSYYFINIKVFPDGIHFISVSMAGDLDMITITLWNKEQESQLYKYCPNVEPIGFNMEIFDNENILIEYGCQEVYMFNIYNKTILRRYHDIYNDAGCYMKALDSKTFIIGTKCNTIRIWDIECENESYIYQGPHFDDEVNPEMDTTSILVLDSKRFISGNENGNIVLWRPC